ncbi:MAG: ELWxxDGT repeat protein [Flavobacteriaceae bacterium]
MKTKLLFIISLFLSLNVLGQNITLVKDIYPGAIGSGPEYFFKQNNKLYFYAFTEQNGRELWISDGTENGTKLLKDINPGDTGSISTHTPKFINYNNKVYFTAYNEDSNYELWETDGTEDGSKLFVDINAGSNGSYPDNFTINNGTLYFNAGNDTNGKELWKTNGTVSGTNMVVDNQPGTPNGGPGNMISFNNRLFMSVSNPTTNSAVTSGKELRALSNGQSSFEIIKDIDPGSGSGNPSNFIIYNNKLFFSANDGEKGYELWITDGSTNGTFILKDINEGNGNSSPGNFIVSNNILFFTALNGQLWKTDGTENGTVLVKDINPNGNKYLHISSGIDYNNLLYFWADDQTSGLELWVTDGTENGTVLVKDMNPNGNASTTAELILFNNKLYFVATNGTDDYKLWESNGTEQGTKMVEDNSDVVLKNNADGSKDLTVVDNKIYFYGYNATYGKELYVYNPFSNQTYVPDNNFEQDLIDLGYDDVLDDYVITSNINTITNLNLENKNISDLTGIEAFTSLKTLNVKNNLLASLDLSMLTTLEELNCAKNEITNLNIKRNQSLKNLYCENNRLSNLDISDNTHLQTLSFHSNSIEQINITNFLQLETLICRDNMLTSLDISTNSNLHTLSAINNSLDCIQVSNVTDAITNWSADKDAHATFSTDCSDVWTINVDPTLLTSLHSINGLDANNDGSITLAEAAALTGTLDLSNRGISSVEGLQAFTGISTLNLSGNSITDLSPLTGLSIEIISRNSNTRKTVVSRSMALENLIISNNTFESLNLNGLTNLKTVDISNNPELVTVSIKNNNNSAITSFNSSNTPKLTCILVDDKDAGYLNSWTLDAANSFAADEADCSQRVLSTDDEISKKELSIYPNPVSSTLTIKTTHQIDQIKIFNYLGKQVLDTNNTKINIQYLKPGMYVLKIISGDKIAIRKILKK